MFMDEQEIYIDGKKKYRVSLHDAFIKYPIAENNAFTENT
jgi:hypothetical protein